MGYRKLPACKKMWVGLYGCILLNLLLLGACGVPPAPAHPLSADPLLGETPVTVMAQRKHIEPIQVSGAQSTLTTYPGGQMKMTISTSPYALCSFSVDYGRGAPSHNVGVLPHAADGNGVASWSWRVDGDAHTGTWPMTISAVLPDGLKTVARVNVVVTFPPINVVATQSSLVAAPKGNIALTISTAPSSDCTVALSYRGAQTKFLPAHSDYNGLASWSWHVEAGASAGVWPLTVTVTLADGEKTSAPVNVTIL
ncbi:hypothetical protein EPA93_39570 [Ktedonosporobacter rubrisoli]|uniref:Uncharacterized protein n=1 Tax=Ktedonosporobacter rubrisoli TaxID=2509675 RepID=A0A4P6K108_KTERU|nr:hypothetical protein [Ktedonosporobacter rubrisoli]QBD81749.1 hypothetical protein EPA93_39570 [Ktedonosporobacter rubrisoli]